MADESVLKSIEPADIIAVLGKGSEFEGKLTFEGVVRLDGRFHGRIFSNGTLIIGETGKVQAEIEVPTVVVKGEVRGNIKAASCLELHQPARLVGNIFTPCLYVQKGVTFEGNTHMGEADSIGDVTQPIPLAD
jgi:cytoskeletal protein CcmA (bactofilin family)